LRWPGRIINPIELRKEFVMGELEKLRANTKTSLKNFQNFLKTSKLKSVSPSLNTNNLVEKKIKKEKLDFTEAIKNPQNAHFKLNLETEIFLPFLLGLKNHCQKTINYEIKEEEEKSFLCHNCSLIKDYCTLCNNKGQYNKLSVVLKQESVTLDISKEDLSKGYLIIYDKGNSTYVKGEKIRGSLIIQFTLGSNTLKEKIKFNSSELRIFKSITLEELSSNKLEIDIFLENFGKIITLSKSEIKGIPFKKDISTQINERNNFKKLNTVLFLTVGLN